MTKNKKGIEVKKKIRETLRYITRDGRKRREKRK